MMGLEWAGARWGGGRGAAAGRIAVARGSPAVRRAPAVAISVSISEGNLARKQRDHKTYKSSDDLFHSVFYLLNFTGAVWLAYSLPEAPRQWKARGVDERT